MSERICRTQADVDAAIAAGDVIALDASADISVSVDCEIICRAGEPRVVARESSQPRVEARESSQPRVEARGSSQPRVVARESSQPRVEARESSQPRVEAWESSQPRVEAWGSSQPRVKARGSSQPRVEAWGSSQPRVVAWESSQPRVEARGSSQPRVVAKGFVQLSVRGAVHVSATAAVAILIGGGTPTIDGGGYVQRIDSATPATWCDYYGVDTSEDGVVVLYKAVGDDWKPTHTIAYEPGTTPEAPDWDGGERECGGGLHFSPSPRHAREFFPDATHFIACPVRLNEMAVHPDGQYPQKCKAKRVCAPCWEVDEDGERIGGES